LKTNLRSKMYYLISCSCRCRYRKHRSSRNGL